MNEIQRLLERLSNAHGISGREGSIQEIVREEIGPLVDEIRVDNLGNLVATKKGERPSVMVAAHMDEIGLMTKYVDEKGFIRFVTIGGWFDQTLLNQRVIVHADSGPVCGVIGSKPPHVMTPEDRKKPIEIKDMFVDAGCVDQDEAKALGIKPGTPMSIDRTFTTLAGDRVTGKALDNRAGVVMMIEALKRTRSKSTIYAVGTVQEEVGLKGAKTSAFDLRPDVALATDVTIPGDHPGIEKKDSALEIGKGAVITIADASGRGLIASEKVVDWLAETAREFEIAVQMDVSGGGTTDATAIQLTREGIHTGLISVATRYIHSPVEVLSIKDLEASAELIARALETAPRYFKRG
ncbi:MAG: M42 family metallopeptidase [Methanothrix sp.]|jgi:endoglucanase|uniref:Peptidase M42 family protein n=1 Tax=Methanothrix harundinacea TaxID=301375 RepID=A0A117LG75_9EURY|nr:MAG: Peptidase M42 family protein [Methanothrix harundinacea]MDD3708958.1 M42 family metallopeptidase [Methanothrix sp.]MDI9398237.1 M42 family metallopeptidase [Euryarchaeota archaeon]KUK97180.1 MAG: Peptidase M42 family protein [Methanothrix harundinacea]MCP1391493.1 M42 family metallopeptidase [Methanothrix harundinacea]